MNAGGSISWAAFLRMGALRENSPNKNLRPSWNQPKIPVPLHQLFESYDLFQSSRTNVVEHVMHIYEDEELEESSTCRKFRQVRKEGKRMVKQGKKLFAYIKMQETTKFIVQIIVSIASAILTALGATSCMGV